MLLSLALALTLTAPEHVSVGVQLRNVEAIDLQENAYHANFVLWVTWSGERDATKTLRFTNLLGAWAMTLSPVFDEPLTLADGRHY